MNTKLCSLLMAFSAAWSCPCLKAAQFDGASRIDVSDPSGALTGNSAGTAATIECWFKLSIPSTVTLSKNMVILGNARRSDPSGNFAYLIQFNIYTGNIEFSARGASGLLPTQTLVSRPYLERWYHIAVTRSGEVFTGYVDGRQSFAIGSTDIGSPANTNGLFIGGTPDDSANLYGEVQEVALYQSTLTQNTIIDYMFQSQPASLDPTLKGYFTLDSNLTLNLTNQALNPPSGTSPATKVGNVAFEEASLSGEQSSFDSHKNGGRDALAPLSGALSWQHTLFKRPTTGIPLEFKIGYNSAQAHNGVQIPQFPAFDTNGLGAGWTHNFDSRIVPSDTFQPGGSASTVGLLMWDGSLEVWDFDDGAGAFKPRHGEYRGDLFFSGSIFSSSSKMIWITPERLQFVFNTPYAGSSSQRGRLVQIKDFAPTPNVINLTWSTNGFLQTVTDTAGGALRFKYDAQSRLDYVGYLGPDIDHPLWKAAFTYNAQNRLSTFGLTGPAEHTSTPAIPTTWGFFYKTATDNTNGLLEKIADPRGYNGGTPSYYDVTIAYDQYARVTSTTDGINRVQKTQYNVPAKRQISRTDAFQSTQGTPKNTVETYDRKSRVLSRKDQLGNTNSFEYNDDPAKGPNGTITATVDANGTRITFEYDARGNALKQTVVPLNQVKQWEYNATIGSGANSYPLNKPTKQIDPPAIHLPATIPTSWVTNFEYDATGNLKRQFDALGDIQSFNYNARGQVLDTTDATGNTTSFAYTTEGFLLTKTVPGSLTVANRTWSYTYTDLGWLKTETTPVTSLGALATQTFQDINGNTNRVIDAANRTFLKTFDANSNLLIDTDAKSQQTVFTYDNADQKLTMQQRDHTVGAPRIWSYDYTLRGELWHVRDPSLSAPDYTITKDYNDAGRLIKETDANGFFSSVQYDAVGNVRFATDKEGKVSETRYDPLNRVIFQQDPELNATQTAYDNAGRIDTITLPNGKSIMRHSYDGRSRLKQWTDAESRSWIYSYDANGNILDIEDALHGHYVMTYGERNERRSELNQDGKLWSYTYDELLRLKTQTDPSNITRTLLYDEVSRVDTVSFSTGRSTSFFYDQNSNPLEIRRTDANGVIKTKPLYDAMDRVYSISDTLTNKIVGYTYDGAGRVKTTVYPGNLTLTRVYDKAGRLTDLNDWAASPRNSHFTYDKVGRLLTHGYPNGITSTFAYDKSGRMTALAHPTSTSPIVLTYAYDRNGNKIATPEKGTLNWQVGSAPDQVPEIDETFTVKPDGKLISSTDTKNTARNTSFAYSDNGNMLTSSSTAVSTVFTYDEDNRATSLTYTPQAPLAQQVVTNRYDALGRRLARTLTVNSTTAQTQYVLDLLGDMERILCDVDAGGTISTRYVHGPNGLGYKEDATTNQITCFHTDAQGNILRLTGGTGNSVADYAYTPYGRVLASSGTAATANTYRFVGSQGVIEEFPGIYFMRARYYSTDTMRFLSVDPVKNIGPGWKPEAYAYATGNPLRYGDPKGTSSEGFDGFLSSLGSSFGEDFVKAAGKGAIWGLNNGYRTANELLGTIKGGIIDTFGGANIVDPLGGALGSYIGDRILEAYTGPSKSIPGVGLIPYLGSFFGTYQEAGGDLTPEELAEIKRKSGNQSTARTNISAQANSSVTLIASSLAKTSSAVSYASSTNSSQTSKLAPVATPANTLTASGGTGGGGGTSFGNSTGASSSGSSSSSYTIRSGDTIGNLAYKFGVTSNQLLAANPQVTNPNKIYTGASLAVPSKK